jgi:hypothetical protein
MPLTKVRLPVADIQRISNGSSNVDIPTASGNVTVTATGVLAATFGSTANTLHRPTVVTNLDDVENVDLTVSGGATGVLEAIASAIRLWTTSGHTLILGANSIVGMTIGTDGRVTLGVEGNAASHVVSKAYVDAAAAAAIAGITASLTSPGHISIPTNTSPLIINWGITANLSKSFENVTFDEAFPNAALAAFCSTRMNNNSSVNASLVDNVTTTGMTVRQTQGSPSSPVYWMAIGF